MQNRANVLIFVAVLLGPTLVSAKPERVDPTHQSQPLLVVADELERPQVARIVYVLGGGGAGISGSGEEDFSTAVGMTMQLGYRIERTVHFVLDGEYATYARYQPDRALSQQQSSLTLGFRYTPFPEREPDALTLSLSSFSMRVGLGVGHQIQIPYGTLNPLRVEQGRWGGAAMVGLGWYPIRGRDFALGADVSDSAVLYADGVRHNFGLMAAIELTLFR